VKRIFHGAFYLLEEAQNINNVVPCVLPPTINTMGTDYDGNYIVSWQENNPDAIPSKFQLDELKNLQIITDSVPHESYWNFDGFFCNKLKAHSDFIAIDQDMHQKMFRQ